MGTIVLGYVPKPEGEAALVRAIAESKLRGASLIVVNTQKNGGPDEALLAASGRELHASATSRRTPTPPTSWWQSPRSTARNSS